MPGTPLTPQQIAFFETFGFLVFPGLLKDRIERITQSFEEVWQSHGGGHAGQKHDGKRRSCIVQFADRHEYLNTLLDDPRIEGIGSSLLGDDFNYMGSDGNYYAGDTGWHSDGFHNPPDRHIKIAYYLDPLTKDTGCLRVIPGSHIGGDKYHDLLVKQMRNSVESWGVEPRDIPCIALETKPGDVAVFNHNTLHAAFGGGGWRRMFTMNLCKRYDESRLQVLRDYISGGARFWVERNYDPTILRTASTARMRHLEQVHANDGHLKALSDAARLKMAEPSRG